MLLHIILRKWSLLWGRDKKKNNSNNGGINKDGRHGSNFSTKGTFAFNSSQQQTKTQRNATTSTSTKHSDTRPPPHHTASSKEPLNNRF
jgi:hypothetical protein